MPWATSAQYPQPANASAIATIVPTKYMLSSMSVRGRNSNFRRISVRGCIARLLASRAAYGVERSMTVMERDKMVTLDFSRDPHTEVAIHRPAPGLDGSSVQVERHQVEEDNPLRRELTHFLARISRSEPPVGTAEDDLRSLELATRLLQHMRVTQLDELESAFL